MKKIIIIAAIIFTGFFFNNEAKTPHPGAGFGFFYSELSPYGTWIELEAGLVVWRPAFVRRGWAPYSMGRWVWTEYGWYWDSYEHFGHIVYHYGRWYYDDYYGWIWIPDYEWAPAWVEWRYDDYYIGWAPLPPYAVFSINIGIHFTHDYYNPYHHWHFVRFNNFCDPYVYNHYVGPKYKYRIYSTTKYRNEYGYYNGRIMNRGVDVDYVRKRSGQSIKQREIVRVNNTEELGRTRDKDKIRSYMDTREEIAGRNRTGERNVEIKRSDRKTSLVTNKVELGERRRVSNDSNDRRNEVIQNDKTRRERITNDNTKNNESGRVLQKPNERTINRTNTQTGNDRVREVPEKKIEKKENPIIKKNENQNDSRRRTETKIQRNTESKTEAQKNNVRKVETQRNIERKAEVQRDTEKKSGGQRDTERNNSGSRRR